MDFKKTMDKAIKMCDAEEFYQLRFGSGKIEGIKGDIELSSSMQKI